MRSLFVVAFSVALIVGATPAFAAPGAGAIPRLGKAPEVHLNAIQGETPTNLSDLNGNVVILTFFASWCRACNTAMPTFERLHRRHQAQGLRIIGVSSERESVIRHHVQRRGVSYAIGQDRGATRRAYGIRALPTYLVIDKQGEIRFRATGFYGRDVRQVRAMIPRLLAE